MQKFQSCPYIYIYISGGGTITITTTNLSHTQLLRGELIALHSASSYPGAQLYMECAQLRVTGGGSTTPASYNIPGIYSGSDPGIKFNLYAGATSYTIPGPRPFTCSGGGGTPQQPPSTPVPVPTQDPTPPPPSGGGTVVKWGQCGGIGFTGPTGCVSGSTCIKVNDYYCKLPSPWRRGFLLDTD